MTDYSYTTILTICQGKSQLRRVVSKRRTAATKKEEGPCVKPPQKDSPQRNNGMKKN
jgi:hypothetical protein